MAKELPQIQTVGIVRLDIRDAETMEIKRSYEQTNAISQLGVYSVIMTARTSNQSTFFGNGSGKGSAEQIAIGDRVSSNGMRTMATAFTNRTADPLPGSFKFEDSIPSPWTFFEGSPDYAEKTGRFNQPSSTRTINTIMLADDFDNFAGFATAALNTACTQTTSEVLDVTYRIQFFYQTPDPTLLPVSNEYGRIIARGAVGSQAAFALSGRPHDQTYMGISVPTPETAQILNCMVADGEDRGSSDLIIKDHLKAQFLMNKTISTNIGTIIKSVGYGGDNDTNFMNGNDPAFTIAWAPVAPDTFVNKPIQTIHNHNANAIEWGLDVDFLATSQGSLTLDGSSWTDPDWPEFYRIEHFNTGQVGTSRYMWRVRRTTGFDGNSYRPPAPRSSVAMDFMNWTHWEDGGAWWDPTAPLQTITGGHGLRTQYSIHEYDEQTFITWDDESNVDQTPTNPGITINNVNKCDIRNFDATTTPALPVLGRVAQVAVDSSGNIWVAATGSGLFRIEDPFGSPTVTQMTEASNSLPVGSEDSCYAVAIGFNGDLLAVVEGALVRSTNPTAATPTFASETISYTGITDNNWANVLYMRTDPDSPDYESCIVAQISGTTQQLVWWSTSQTGISGPVSGSYTVGGTGFARTRFGRLKCSARGSLWDWMGTGQNASQCRQLQFGSAATDQVGNGNVGYGSRGFFYDYYDTPYHCSANSNYISMWSADEKHHGGHDSVSFTQTFYTGAAFVFETGNGKGCFLNRDSNTTNAGEGGTRPLLWKFMGPRDNQFNDALNGRYSPQEELLWRKYHWNGASWELNYYADATDTATHSGGPYPGARHNFDTEDHTFTGRSMIDVTDAFATGNFAATAVATFAFKLIPEAKLSDAADTTASAQEKPRVLLDVSDATQQFQILWDSDIQGNIQIVEDGSATTILATPANSSTYRLVVTLNGTSCKVYLDGSQIGSTVTLSNSYDWSNSSSDLKAFVGCEVYNWNYPQRNTPWQNNFYRGVMENVQIWDSEWDAADVTSDFGDIDGTIAGGTEPAANQVARYQLTQSLAGLETKTTHAGAEALNEGITIAFANGASPDAFVESDYHTFGVVDGIFKDNAIAFTQNYSIYFTPVDHSFTVFENGTAGTDIEAATTAITDEKAIFMNRNPIDADRGISTGQGNSGNYQTDTVPGQLGLNRNSTAGHTQAWGAHTVQHISGNGYFEASPLFGDDNVIIGLTDNPSNNHTAANIEFGIRLNPAGDVDIIEDNSVVASAVATYTITDSFRITRTGTTITYEKVIAGVPSNIHTSGTTSSGDVYGRVSLYEEGHGVKNAIITYTRPGYILTVGSPSGPDGFFDPDFFRVETQTPESISINIGGSPATVNVSETYYSAMTVPGPGEVTVNGLTGWLIFNSADVGSVITGDVTVIYDQY